MQGIMKCFLIILLWQLVACEHAVVGRQSYEGYVVLTIHAYTPGDHQFVKDLQLLLPDSDFWREGNGVDRPSDLMLSPSTRNLAEMRLQEAGIRYDVVIENLQELIDAERRDMERSVGGEGRALNLESFNSYNDIVSWMDQMASTYPTLASVQGIGKTYENREMKLIKIGTDPSKPVVWIDGGIHAREWLSPATVLWFINKLLTTYATDSEIKTLVDSVNWHILPVHNPDGYEFSRSSSRLWRKTRTPTGFSSIFTGPCFGVDPNRNWDSGFGTVGISHSGCSDIYCGSEAHSEPCVKNVVQYLTGIKSSVKVYLTLHSYSQMLLLPYGYTNTRPIDYRELYSLGGRVVEALRSVYGTSYTYGTIPDLLYPASGGSIDWVYDTLGVKYSYAFELRDRGAYGFIAPASEIRPSGEETWVAVKTMVKEVIPVA